MSVATNKITSQFKNSFIRVAGEDTTDIEKAFFKMGFRWAYQDEGKRQVRGLTDAAYLRVNGNCEISYAEGFDIVPEDFGYDDYTEVSRNYVLEAAETVRKIKREESKAQKKRAKARKWDKTATPNSFIGCPVRGDAVVAYKMATGRKAQGEARHLRWTDTGEAGDIVSYKVVGHKKSKDGWIAHDPAKDPAPTNAARVRLRGGSTREADDIVTFGTHSPDGVAVDEEYQVVAYTLQPEKPAKTSVVSMEDMVQDVAWDLGKDVAVPVHDFETQRNDNNVIQLDTNPKKQFGVQSIPLSMWSSLGSAYGALAFYNGAGKYGKANYANTPVEASIYIDGAMRHLAAWVAGEEFDPKDGVPNLGGVLANVAIILEARAAGTLIDDRCKQSGYLKEREALSSIVKHLNELHEGKNPKHYTMETK
jgi:hypothetical protein